jgi:hemerythrin-like metal-binding protein
MISVTARTTAHGDRFIDPQPPFAMKRSHRTYPDWLYNAIPFIYLFSGLLVDLLVDGLIASLLGFALIASACVVWFIRYRYRQAFERAEESSFGPTLIGAEDLPQGGLVQVSWSKALESGHPLIDGQHRRLFGLASEAMNILLARESRSDEEALLDQLVAHMNEHFSTEEDLLEDANDPGLSLHKAEHLAMLAKAKSLRDRFHTREAITKELVTFLSEDVISNHIIREDLSLITSLR